MAGGERGGVAVAHRSLDWPLLETAPPPAPRWLRALRDAAAERFALPTARDEEFKYTPLKAMAEVPFESPPRADAVGAGIRLVNGCLSPVRGLPPGARATALLDFDLRVHLEARPDSTPMGLLNLSRLGEGVVLEIEGDVRTPIEIRYLETDAARPFACFPRVIVLARPGSRASLVEDFTGGSTECLMAAVTDVVLEAGAVLDHVRLQREGPATWHLCTLRAWPGPDSRLASASLLMGGRLGRDELRVHLGAGGARCDLAGLSLARGSQQLDALVDVDHAVGSCTSDTLFKGILDGGARTLFHGRVEVRPGAQRSDARQINRNLLLSEGAVAVSRPQLHVHADDVKCAHGVATGSLRQDALFYLRSRGVDLAEARRLLTRAFALEVLERVRVPTERERLSALVEGWLEG